MKNIFKFHKRTIKLSTINHQLSTLIPAHQRTNIVILKSAIVTSILKNLSIKKVKKSSTDVLRSLSTQTKYGNKEMVIRYKDVKIDKGINSKLFKVED